MIDQVDDRDAFMDILFGAVKNIKMKRPNLHIVLCASTTAAVKLKDFFDGNYMPDNGCVDEGTGNFQGGNKSSSKIICVSHPSERPQVQTYYLSDPCSDFIKATIQIVLDIHNGTYENDASVSKGKMGGILIFMPGKFEVDTTVRWLKDELLPYDNSFGNNLYKASHVHSGASNDNKVSTLVLALHGKLSNSEQRRCFLSSRSHERKIIVATKIAETSLTVTGIDYVVDTMFTRFPIYDAKAGKQFIANQPISKMSAARRADKAGRNGGQTGKCFRLCTAKTFETLREEEVPELCRSELTRQLLYLKSLGVSDFNKFSFLETPSRLAFARAFGELHALKAIDDEGNLTFVGQTISRFQCSPKIAKTLLNSIDHGCTDEILTICAMIQVQMFLSAHEGKKRFKRPRNCLNRSLRNMAITSPCLPSTINLLVCLVAAPSGGHK